MRKTRSDKGQARIDLQYRDRTIEQRLEYAKALAAEADNKKKRYSNEYRAYLREYSKKLKQGFTMEKIYTKQDFQNFSTQAKRQGMSWSAAEAVRGQTLQLTGAEKEALKKALDSLEKDWGKKNFDDLTIDAKKRINRYFSMTAQEKERYLSGAEGELFRHDTFAGFASLGRYYNENSPHE